MIIFHKFALPILHKSIPICLGRIYLFFSVPVHNFSQNPNTHSDDELAKLKSKIADLEKVLAKSNEEKENTRKEFVVERKYFKNYKKKFSKLSVARKNHKKDEVKG